MVRLGLTSFCQRFRAPQLHRFVAEDFANPKVLDEFQPAVKGGAIRAFGPELLVHSWAGNVPALPLWSLVCGLLVKAGNIGKVPSAEPLFASLFARLLARGASAPGRLPGRGVVEGRRRGAVRRALRRSRHGAGLRRQRSASSQIRRQLPVTTRFLPYGHKLGLGLIGRDVLDAQRGLATARLAAHDVVRYDQQGCYSPHLFYVERGGRVAPREFAQYLASELANLRAAFSAPGAGTGRRGGRRRLAPVGGTGGRWPRAAAR